MKSLIEGGTSVLKFFGFTPTSFFHYAVLLLLSAVGGVCAVLWWKNVHLENAVITNAVTISQASTRIDTQQGEIRTLERLRKLDTTTLADLQETLLKLHHNATQRENYVQWLETTNSGVKDYRSAPVPPELGCVWDGTCEDRIRLRSHGDGSTSDVVESAGNVPDPADPS